MWDDSYLPALADTVGGNKTYVSNQNTRKIAISDYLHIRTYKVLEVRRRFLSIREDFQVEWYLRWAKFWNQKMISEYHQSCKNIIKSKAIKTISAHTSASYVFIWILYKQLNDLLDGENMIYNYWFWKLQVFNTVEIDYFS